MKVINFAETNSVLNQYVAEIRDVAVQGDRMRFRRNIERIGEIMAYEMSKELTYSVKQVQTPLGVASVSTPDDEVVIATVFRAGLPLHTGFLNMFDHAGNAFVSAYRYYKDKECPYGGCTHRIHRYSGFVQEDIIDCRPDACHGRKYGIGLEGLRHQGDAGQVADSLCHSQPAGRRASGKAVPWR